MQQLISLFIGFRYMRKNTIDKFGIFLSNLSTIGITIGVISLIVVTSVMNGFEKSLQSNTLIYMPHVILTSKSKIINYKIHPITEIQNIKGIHKIESIVFADVGLQSKTNIGSGVMIGIESSKNSLLLNKLIIGKPCDLINGSYNVYLGNKLAETLNIKYGDKIRIIIPNIIQLTPIGHIPNNRLFNVAGIFYTNSDSDSNELVVSQQDAIKMLHYPDNNITGWRLFLKNPLEVDKLSKQILPDGLIWTDWRERKGEYFYAIRMEKNIMGLLVSFIIFVAALNIITSLFLLVIEKQSEIAILKTLGLNKFQILIIFIIQGISFSFIGVLIGSILGVLLSNQLNLVIQFLGFLPKNVTLPILINYLDVLTIAFFTIIISIIATIYPSLRASSIKPIEFLSYE
ncbi:Lipoprotein-releasing system transmembrane protein LolC [Candidatus Providencia siddallii]|uniref:Lipoprotein-releasing system transmembrane protein LolC n=1 Tax=Candidatus Providencia siddallii TaxID=1715285 RepID=A0A0M6W6Y5_9GAMM|nr:Lipoprotein-releasing system transmembrane protein LolC [Candidatus Providencia siddallii]